MSEDFPVPADDDDDDDEGDNDRDGDKARLNSSLSWFSCGIAWFFRAGDTILKGDAVASAAEGRLEVIGPLLVAVGAANPADVATASAFTVTAALRAYARLSSTAALVSAATPFI